MLDKRRLKCLKGEVWEGVSYEVTFRSNLQPVLARELSFGHKRTMRARERGMTFTKQKNYKIKDV